MERVDVVVVGENVEAMAAAWGAANGGVRAILVAESPLPSRTQTLYGLRRTDLEAFDLDEHAADRVLDKLQVEGSEPVALGGDLAIHAMLGAGIERVLVARARKAGVEIRERARAVRADLDEDGWHLQLSRGEPIRAPILVVADGARSRTLETIGVAQAQRFTASAAEVATFLCATWEVGPQRAQELDSYRIIDTPGPLGRCEVLPGSHSITAGFGPVWRGVAKPDLSWPSPTACGAVTVIETVARRLDLSANPTSVGVEEYRLDALPSPATFDGGMVVGSAAGDRPRRPLTCQGQLIEAGQLAGAAAAKCVLSKNWSAAALAAGLGDNYAALTAGARAELDFEARGGHRPRELPAGFWRGGASSRHSWGAQL